MFRKSLFTMLLLGLSVGALYSAPPVFLYPSSSVLDAGCPHSATGTATYALSSAITGTASSAIDLGTIGCFFFSVTSTGGAPVYVEFSNLSYTAFSYFGTAVAGNYAIPKMARYCEFLVPGQQSFFNPLYTTPTAVTTSVWYYLPSNWPN